MYSYRSKNRKNNGVFDYVMPFLIIICAGIILVLLYSLVKFFFGGEEKASAYLHMVEGNAQMRTWGTDEFFNISSDALVMSGDEVVSSGNAKFIIEFFDGTVMRMNGNTDVIFTEMMDGGDSSSSVNLMLVDGEIWFNKIYKSTAKNTEFAITTSKVSVKSLVDSIFEIESGASDAIRVLNGQDVTVDIMSEDGKKVVATEGVGVGQEVVLGTEAMDRYWKYQSPNVLVAIADEFKQSDWYNWNRQEDLTPTKFEKSMNGYSFVKVAPEIIVPVETSSGVLSGSGELAGSGATESGSVVEENAEKPVIGVKLATPTVTDVSGVTQKDEAGVFVVKVNPAIIAGGVSESVSAVYVNDYKLQKYRIGDKTWKYYANASYGLMQKGDNIYKVYFVDADGNKSDVLIVKVKYTPVETSPSTTGSGSTGTGPTI